ncbi:hypothetical protein [Microseira sp. BLCC-F43]|uniref:hypothetical protein n=1 Tax=Microseira sp. BLCC-F43 TaxID=3153602 RepID=UPI0035BA5ADF
MRKSCNSDASENNIPLLQVKSRAGRISTPQEFLHRFIEQAIAYFTRIAPPPIIPDRTS